MSDTVVVTGVSGFLASHVAVQLLEAGYRVRGTVRDPGKSDTTRKAILAAIPDAEDRLDLVGADLTSDEGWDAAVSGARYVMHTASPFPIETPKTDAELVEPARQGTLRVLQAATAAGVERVVLTSSIAAIIGGHDRAASPLGADAWSDVDAPRMTAYTRSKTIAERAAWDYVGETAGSPELVAVNPGAILGPVLIPRLGTSNRIVEQVLSGGLPAVPRVGFGTVDVRDTARAHLLAMTTADAAGRRFPVVAGFLWLRDVGIILSKRYPDRRVPVGELSDWLVRILARFNPAVGAVVQDLGVRIDIDASDAIHILDWQPRPIARSVVDTAENLLERGLIR